MEYKRKQIKTLQERLAEPRGKIQVLAGSRQVGKSTLIRQFLAETPLPHIFENADNIPPENNAWIADVWQSARSRMILGGHKEFLLVIDEVHKIDRWSEAVKREWDSDTYHGVNIKVVLLGSSRLLLKDGLTESLAGRFELVRMPHWSYAEMKAAFGFTLEEYVYFGGYPGSAAFIRDERRWRGYIRDSIIEPVIAHDVLTTKTVYKPALMKQVFDLGCTYSGEELSLNKMVGQLQDAGNVTTVANYLTTLAETHVLAALHKYASGASRRYNSVPKLMVYNTALLSAQLGVPFVKAFTTPALWGRWVESCVGSHLLNLAEDNDYHVSYWRERDKEVDFVVERGRTCVAIEVKSGARTAGTGLSSFAAAFNPHRTLVVGTGGVPLEEFLNSDLLPLF